PQKTLQPGKTVQLRAVGYDQYGATFPMDKPTWSIAGAEGQAAAEISATGLFTARSNSDSVLVAASHGSIAAKVSLRVGPAPRADEDHRDACRFQDARRAVATV
ncbi:MAG TPA: hypothetical protein VD858_17945, partial [Reyranella sp.]|nr:hypothetical protein [Reyranella sp.]